MSMGMEIDHEYNEYLKKRLQMLVGKNAKQITKELAVVLLYIFVLAAGLYLNNSIATLGWIVSLITWVISLNITQENDTIAVENFDNEYIREKQNPMSDYLDKIIIILDVLAIISIIIWLFSLYFH